MLMTKQTRRAHPGAFAPATGGRRRGGGLWVAALWIAGLIGLTGCVALDVEPPSTPAELTAQVKADPNAFTDHTTILHNLQRTLDPDLPVDQRIRSLKVVELLDDHNAAHHKQLASLLSTEGTPPALRLAVLEMLVRADYLALGPHVVAALPYSADPGLRQALLDWLARHRQPGVLADVLKLWASDDPDDPPSEGRYRRVVETITGRTWPDALLEALNRPVFSARGSAVELLASRVPVGDLQGRLMALKPRTPAVLALQYYVRDLRYVPASREELLFAVMVYMGHRRQLGAAVELAGKWTKQYGYRFAIRDFHLLSRLSSDPTWSRPDRPGLIVKLAERFASRRASAADPSAGGTGSVTATGIIKQLAALSMSDLVRLAMIDKMLGRQRVQRAIRIMAGRDRQDRSSQWGGLIFYENGRADARLYPPGTTGDDRRYAAGKRMFQDATDSLAHFQGHFWTANNAAAIAPSDADLLGARKLHVPGVILTSLTATSFNAVYYDTQGIRVNMGGYPYANGLPAR